MTDVEKAYLAGIFDSRCYIGVRPRSGKLEPQLEICRSRPVLDRIQRIIGAGQIQPYKTGFRYRLRGARVSKVLDEVGVMMESEARWALDIGKLISSAMEKIEAYTATPEFQNKMDQAFNDLVVYGRTEVKIP